ncbi:hypothetical protein V8D89_000310 [Ganoderma adspersum]
MLVISHAAAPRTTLLVRSITSIGTLICPGFPCRPWHTNVAPRSGRATATSSLTIGEFEFEDDTRRWRRDGNRRTEWLPEPSRRASPRFQPRTFVASRAVFCSPLHGWRWIWAREASSLRRATRPSTTLYSLLDLFSSLSVADACGASNFGLGLALGLCVLSGDACIVLCTSSSERRVSALLWLHATVVLEPLQRRSTCCFSTSFYCQVSPFPPSSNLILQVNDTWLVRDECQVGLQTRDERSRARPRREDIAENRSRMDVNHYVNPIVDIKLES